MSLKTPPQSQPEEKRKPGRPKGAERPPVVQLPPRQSQCPVCGSCQRSKYFYTKIYPVNGRTPTGFVYTHVAWRRCKCSLCGKVRIDRTYEQHPEGFDAKESGGNTR